MERTFLENFGLEKEQIDQILNQHSREIGRKVNEIESLQQQLDSKAEELTTADKTIKDLQRSNKDNEGLQEKINSYKAQIKDLQANFEQEKIKTTVISELRVAGARDAELVYNLIDKDKLGLNSEGKVIGYEDQINSLTTDSTHAYLFDTAPTVEAVQEQPQQEINVQRGGYDALQGDADVPSIGAIMGQKFKAEAEQKQSSAADFWKSLEG